jgi:hypothetical protein
VLTTLATAVIKQLPDKHLPDGQALARVAAGTRLPGPVVVRVMNEKNRSSEKLPSPLRSEEDAAQGTPARRGEPVPKLAEHAAGGLRIADQPPLIFHMDDVTPETVQGLFDNYRSSLPEDLRVLC